MAARSGLDFGSDIVFTYGPLGFLAVPRFFFGETVVAGLALDVLVHLAMAGTIVYLARRSLPTWLALPVALVLARIQIGLASYDVLMALLFIGTFEALRKLDASTRVVISLIAGAALVTGALFLVKLNTGITAFAIFGVGAWGTAANRFRAAAGFVVATVLSTVGLWIASGHEVAQFSQFLSHALEVISGHNTAMTFEQSTRLWEYPAAVVVAGILVTRLHRETSSWQPVRRVAAMLMTGLFLLSLFKAGFVRHDGHSIVFFATSALIYPAFVSDRQKLVPRLVAGAVMLLAFGAAMRITPLQFVTAATSARAAFDQLHTALMPERRTQVVEEARAAMRAAYGLDPRTLALVRGKTVHVDPWETAAAWAYPELRWNPAPVFQAYLAYTPELDRLNARFLASAEAPQRILRHTQYIYLPQPSSITAPSLDGRNPDFESPESALTMLCHYAELHSTHAWQVLGKTADRCSAPRLIDSVEARFGETIHVPSSGFEREVVFARARGVNEGLGKELRALLFRSETWFVYVNGQRFKLVPDTAAGSLILHIPRRARYSPPYDFDEVRTLAISDSDAGAVGATGLTLEFYAVRIKT